MTREEVFWWALVALSLIIGSGFFGYYIGKNRYDDGYKWL